ncbi:g12937 [Coccomyxa viridis]|uniref:G12937 protein n=1 Tax=Coccomyxa viridis TaxID=1274662 RepID=A0ABP1GBK9_9CHLO
MALLHFEQRAEGQAPKRVWPDKYELMDEATKRRADAVKSAKVYIISGGRDYKLKNKDGCTVMEICRPQVHIVK